MSSRDTDTHREWIMSQHFASTWASYTLRSISPMDYLPNGPWQSAFPWIVSYVSNIFHSDKTEHCCLSVCFKTGFTSTYTCFCLSLLPHFIIHLCFSGDTVTDRVLVSGTFCDCKAEKKLVTSHFNYVCSTFFRKFKSLSIDKSGQSYLSNWLVIFSSGLYTIHVLQSHLNF